MVILLMHAKHLTVYRLYMNSTDSMSCGIMQSELTMEVMEEMHVLGFVGENGTLVVDRDGWEVIPEVVNGKTRMEAVPLAEGKGKGLKNHVKKSSRHVLPSRNPNTNVNIEIGAHIAKFSAVGNIAYRTGKKLIWDGTKFTNDARC